MPGEPIHPVAKSTTVEMGKHNQLDHEIRDMIAALTKRLAELQHIHKSGTGGSHGHDHGDSTHHQHHHHQQQQHLSDHEDEHHGVRIITLAGNNQGATMHGEREDKSPISDDDDPYEALGTHVNSNFQAINNSIMMGGSYTTNDPGVHMDISDVIDHYRPDHHDHHGPKMEADGKKGKKKKKVDRENGKGEQHHHSDKSD